MSAETDLSLSTDEKITELWDLIDFIWILVSAVLVLNMQSGFCFLEVGLARSKNGKSVLLKNVFDCIAMLFCWGAGGHAIASKNGKSIFVGTGNWSFDNSDAQGAMDAVSWLFQASFASTAVTIIGGAVIERCDYKAYLMITVLFCYGTYAVICRWTWSEDAWLANSNTFYWLHFMDFAGSGVVHMVGGISGLVHCYLIGPRMWRFGPQGNPLELEGANNLILSTIGTLVLLVAWYGFNCGSTLGLSNGRGIIAVRIAVANTLSCTAAGCTAMAYTWVREMDQLQPSLNSILAGLVGITGVCDTIELWAAPLVGVVAAIGSMWCDQILLRFQIDDPIGVVGVHGVAGMWGVLAVGIFAKIGLDDGKRGLLYGDVNLFCSQIFGMVVLVSYTAGSQALIFWVVNRVKPIRISPEAEEMGMDRYYHHGAVTNDCALVHPASTFRTHLLAEDRMRFLIWRPYFILLHSRTQKSPCAFPADAAFPFLLLCCYSSHPSTA
ncbi:ammonium transporter [Cymbomonas tetramitiformis]|uniref:Ammonium transporter n=1 Tax=Cymbomonas tetramitiformis TaxID=36881 RepID=A0AAE0GV64_9CHLO|nr:ammonium transporter [Cymbomonas tetramitiformis]